MTTSRRVAPLLIALWLAGIGLVGCGPSPAAPAAPAAGGRSRAGEQCDAAGLGHSVEGPGAQRFEVTSQEAAVINGRLLEVFCRQGLWRQDVGFGARYDPERDRYLVLINPGRSGLTARQVLDRLLDRG